MTLISIILLIAEQNDGPDTISIAFDDTTDEVESEQSKPTEHTSKTTKALEIVLGDIPEIYELEKVRNKLSKNMSSHYYKSKYESHLARIQTALLRAVSECKTSVKEWENKVFCETGTLPNPNQYSEIPELQHVLKIQKVALKLLRLWKITVHL